MHRRVTSQLHRERRRLHKLLDEGHQETRWRKQWFQAVQTEHAFIVAQHHRNPERWRHDPVLIEQWYAGKEAAVALCGKDRDH